MQKNKTSEFEFDPSKLSNSLNAAWMMNFADLITVLLAFFILIYSSTAQDHYKLRMLTNSIYNSFNTHKQEDLPEEVAQSINEGVSGTDKLDLDYLYGILKSRIEREPEISYVTINKLDDKIELIFNSEEVFETGTNQVKENSYHLFAFLGKSLIGIGNKIEIQSKIVSQNMKLINLEYIRALKLGKSIKEAGYIYNIDIEAQYVNTSNFKENKYYSNPENINNISLVIRDQKAEEIRGHK